MARAPKSVAEKATETATAAPEQETKAPMAILKEDVVDVVVLPKRTLRHSGKKHRAHSKVSLPTEDVPRLVKLGYVALFSEVRAAALEQEGAVVTVNDGVTFGSE